MIHIMMFIASFVLLCEKYICHNIHNMGMKVIKNPKVEKSLVKGTLPFHKDSCCGGRR